MKDQVVSIMKFKVVLLGEANVGKTAIVNRFVKNSFDQGETKCKPDLTCSQSGQALCYIHSRESGERNSCY